MPRKDRPAPLSDSIFKAKLGQTDARGVAQEDAVDEAIPVHNTFIQFGAPEGIDGSQKKGLTTAPAWVGPSFQSIMNSVVQSAIKASSASPENLGSPRKVPVMRYSLSASSARAAGLPGNSAVVASYQLDRPGSGPATATTQDPGGEKNGEEDEGEDDEEGGESGEDGPSRRSSIPPIPPGELPSIGSAKHHEGACKRCCFFPKGRCLNGHDCEFCHYEHEKRKRKKKKKSKQKEEGSGSEAEVSTPSAAMQQPGTGDSFCAPAGLAGLRLRPLPPLDPAADPTFYGAFDPVMWGVPPLDANTLRSVAGLPLTAPPTLPPQGIPPPCELPMMPYPAQVPTRPAGVSGGDSTTNFASGYGAAIATAAFVLDGSSPNADRGTTPGVTNATVGSFGEVKVPTYAPLPADNASMWAYAAAASGLQANGTVPPAAPPTCGRPPPR
mmetsp:Transcript_81697/g.243590  ORF Transcript_81697/g.243590 Transcript_81697/m.243590 type:complete len:440 (-) Transcript_81697:178-1497(-)